jgi:hypothetical protein
MLLLLLPTGYHTRTHLSVDEVDPPLVRLERVQRTVLVVGDGQLGLALEIRGESKLDLFLCKVESDDGLLLTVFLDVDHGLIIREIDHSKRSIDHQILLVLSEPNHLFVKAERGRRVIDLVGHVDLGISGMSDHPRFLGRCESTMRARVPLNGESTVITRVELSATLTSFVDLLVVGVIIIHVTPEPLGLAIEVFLSRDRHGEVDGPDFLSLVLWAGGRRSEVSAKAQGGGGDHRIMTLTTKVVPVILIKNMHSILAELTRYSGASEQYLVTDRA